MESRLELHEFLCSILGSNHVYFQPPESIRMTYPAIVYELADIRGPKADDIFYLHTHRYTIKYISRDPDNSIINRMIEVPYCTFDRRFIADNLYHDCFTLYFK